MSEIKLPRIVIWGCGAIGSNLAHLLIADRRDWSYLLVDYDVVEARNIPNQWYYEHQIKQKKVEALQSNIYMAYGKIVDIYNQKISNFKFKLTTHLFEFIQKANVWIDCFDNYESRKLLCNSAIPSLFDTLHIAFSASKTFEILWDEVYKPEKVEEQFDICTWPGAKSFINLVCSLASISVQKWVDKNEKWCFLGNEMGYERNRIE